MAMTGYNPEEVRQSIGGAINAYKAYNGAMNAGMQIQFVKPMESVWYGEHAVRIFGIYKSSMDNLYTEFNKLFAYIVNVMNEGGKEWAKSTESVYNNINYDVIPNACDVSEIKLDIAGVKGIDIQRARQIITCFPRLTEEATGALNSLNNAINRCGFIGSNQQESLTSLVNEVSKKTQDFVTNLNRELNEYMNRTTEEYNQVAQANVNRFTS